MKRILSFLLALLMLAPLLAACKDEEQPSPPEDTTLTIAYDVGTVTYAKVKELALAIKEKAGIEVEVKGRQTGKGQLLVGHVESEDVNAALADLTVGNFIMGAYGDSYVITGSGKLTTDAGITYFIEHFLSEIGTGKLQLQELGSYHGDGFQVAGEDAVRLEDLTLYSIVVPDNYTHTELRFAVELQQYLLANARELPICTLSSAPVGGQIRIGARICERAVVSEKHGYTIACTDNDLEVAFQTGLGYAAAKNMLTGTLLVAENVQQGFGALAKNALWRGNGNALATASLATNGDLRIMLNNMYGGHQAIHPMTPRTEMLIDLYFTYMPDVLGLQEYSPSADSTGFIAKLLQGGYRQAPVTAVSDGRQDRTPVLYNPDTVELLKSGYLRFNDLTYNEYPDLLGSYTAIAIKNNCKDASKGFDWAIFRKKDTGEVFLVASVHLWWKTASDARNVVARKIQIRAMKDELCKAAEDFAAENDIAAGTIPIFTGGDYNCNTSSSSPLQQMSGSAQDNGFVNANTIAAEKLTRSTHHSYPD